MVIKPYSKQDTNHANYSLKGKVIKLLIEKKTPLSIRKISKLLGTDYKNTFNTIKGISPDILLEDKKGNINLIEIKLSPNIEIFDVENKRTNHFLEENKKIKIIKDDIISMSYPFFIVLLFGSYVKGGKTQKSDIDLCIISDNKQRSEKLIEKLRLISLPLEVHDFTSDEFESMLDKKGDNLGKEIVKNNIILFGVENYYNLISKWMKKE